MKSSLALSIAIPTVLIFLVAILASLNFNFSLIFFLTLVGQGFLIYMVIRVLKDDYTTEKTFDDFYEDRPIKKEELNLRK